jgi:hypothetical protein
MILDLYLGQKSKAAALVFLAFGFWLLAFGFWRLSQHQRQND